jgi:hypothetical protein
MLGPPNTAFPQDTRPDDETNDPGGPSPSFIRQREDGAGPLTRLHAEGREAP